MAPPAPSLQQLVDSVSGDSPLARLENAATTAQELQVSADSLLDHFVGECRSAGHSWTEISGVLGVTKQAVHKRFSASPNFTLERFTVRARNVLNEAKATAVRYRQPQIGVDHMLVALFPPGGVAAEVLQEAGATKAKLEKKLPTGNATLTADDAVPFTPAARAVLENTLREAIGLGHNYIGTEHVLLALLDDNDATKSLTAAGVDTSALKPAVTAKLADYLKQKRAN